MIGDFRKPAEQLLQIEPGRMYSHEQLHMMGIHVLDATGRHITGVRRAGISYSGKGVFVVVLHLTEAPFRPKQPALRRVKGKLEVAEFYTFIAGGTLTRE